MDFKVTQLESVVSVHDRDGVWQDPLYLQRSQHASFEPLPHRRIMQTESACMKIDITGELCQMQSESAIRAQALHLSP